MIVLNASTLKEVLTHWLSPAAVPSLLGMRRWIPLCCGFQRIDVRWKWCKDLSFESLASIKPFWYWDFGDVGVSPWLWVWHAYLCIDGGGGHLNGYQIVFCRQYQDVFVQEILVDVSNSISRCGRHFVQAERCVSVRGWIIVGVCFRRCWGVRCCCWGSGGCLRFGQYLLLSIRGLVSRSRCAWLFASGNNRLCNMLWKHSRIGGWEETGGCIGVQGMVAYIYKFHNE